MKIENLKLCGSLDNLSDSEILKLDLVIKLLTEIRDEVKNSNSKVSWKILNSYDGDL